MSERLSAASWRRFLLIGGLLAACDGTSSKPADDPPPPDDDYATAEPLPMSVADGSFVAEAEQALAAAFLLGSQAVTAPPRVPAGYDFFASPAGAAVAANRTAVPSFAMREAIQALASLRDVLYREFSASGRFGKDGVKVPVKDGAGARTLRTDDGYARFKARARDAGTEFVIEIFVQDGADARRTLLVEIGARVRVEFRAAQADDGIEIAYDSAARTLALAKGSAARARDDRPARFVARATLLADGVQADGGWVWRTAAPASVPAFPPPRPLLNGDGDVELFVARATFIGGAPALAQRLAYLPAEAPTAFAPEAFPSILAAHAYEVYTRPVLAAILRDERVSPACGTLGARLRAAAPQGAAAALPDDVCRGNLGLSDQAIFDAAISVCATKAGLITHLLRTDGSTAELDWCAKVGEAGLLESPQHLQLGPDGVPKLVLPAGTDALTAIVTHTPPSAEHKAVLEALDAATRAWDPVMDLAKPDVAEARESLAVLEAEVSAP